MNRRRLLSTLLAAVMCAAVFAVAMPMKASAGGSGTESDPYEISDVYELQAMNADLDAHYILLNDIDASGTSSWNGGLGFEPIGTDSAPFTGSLDGDGYVITGLYINRPSTSEVGLFGVLGAFGSEIKNVGLADVDVTGAVKVGGLVGSIIDWCYISNSYAAGSVSGSSNVGGLVGFNDGSISNSYATGSASGSFSIATSVGGLVGSNDGSISNSYATGSASGPVVVGGLVGFNDGPISNSYATGSVSGIVSVGGLVGLNVDSISNSYAAGSVNGSSNVGGLVGSELFDGSTSDSYWDTETSGQSTSAGGTGKTTAEMMQQATFVGWDFVNIWRIRENATYPYHWWAPSSPEDLIRDLIALIEEMNLHHGIENALIAKLYAALGYLEAEDYQAATDVMGAFINHCEAQSGVYLTEAQADELIAAAQVIIEAISDG